MVKPLNRVISPGSPPDKGSRVPSTALVGSLFFAVLVIIGFLFPEKAHAETPPPPTSPIKITRAVGGGAADNVSGWPSLSADGSYLVFSSLAGNLTPDDRNASSDVFIYNTGTKKFALVSLSSQGNPANAASYRPVISVNSRFIAFTSLATNLDAGDINGLPDVYLRDLNTATTIRVSRPPDGSPANGWSDQASLSADGRFVLFISSATNLVKDASRPARQVFLYDTQNKLLRAISGAFGDSSLAAISADGRYIVFVAARADSSSLLLYDRLTDSTGTLDIKIPSPGWQSLIQNLEISADGSRIAFLVSDKNSGTLYLYYRQPGNLVKVTSMPPISTTSAELDKIAMLADGRSLVFTTGAALSLYDLDSARNRELARFASTASSSTTTDQIAVAADGQFIAFQAITNHAADIYFMALGVTGQQISYIAGWVQNELGAPIAGLEVSDDAGHTVRTDAEGNFRFDQIRPGSYTINPVREGVVFSPTNRPILVPLAGVSGLSFVATPEKIIPEARKDIGMPYSLNRGCESPFQECGGPFHGFYRGDCTDLVIDAYTEGVGFDIQLALDRDFLSNPRHYYRWRDARNAHDMWRYFAYTNQIISSDEPYLPGDIVFFDWQLDGVVDHVALVSEVSNAGRPRKIIDATGVTADNPSGLAAEFDWKPYHATRTPGHARWTGLRSSQANPSNKRIPILIIALDSPHVKLRISDTRGRSISAVSKDIPGGNYLATGIGKAISIDQPLMASEWYFIELTSPLDSNYQLGIQLVNAGSVIQHFPRDGVIAAGKSILIPVQLELIDDQIRLSLPWP